MVKSFRGRNVDMLSIAKKHGDNVALGNGHYNGRMDVLENGKVVKTREEVLADWYKTHTVETVVQDLKESKDTVKESIEEVVEKPVRAKRTPKYEDITEEEKSEIKGLKND